MLSTHFPNEISVISEHHHTSSVCGAEALRAKLLRVITKIFCDCGKLKIFEEKNSDPHIIMGHRCLDYKSYRL